MLSVIIVDYRGSRKATLWYMHAVDHWTIFQHLSSGARCPGWVLFAWHFFKDMSMTENEFMLNWLDALAGRIQRGLKDIPPDAFHWQPDTEGNSIALTLWHISRAWDILSIRILGERPADQELWHRNGWESKTGYDPRGKGVGGFGNLAGYAQAEVAQVPKQSSTEALDYLDQVYQALRAEIEKMRPEDWQAMKGKWSGLEQPGYDWVSNFVRDGYEHWGEIKALAAMYKRRYPEGR